MLSDCTGGWAQVGCSSRLDTLSAPAASSPTQQDPHKQPLWLEPQILKQFITFESEPPNVLVKNCFSYSFSVHVLWGTGRTFLHNIAFQALRPGGMCTPVAVLSMCFGHGQHVCAQDYFPGIEAGRHVHCSKAET